MKALIWGGAIALLAAAAGMTPAAAQVGTGCHVGVQAGYGIGSTQLSQGGGTIDGVGSRTVDGLAGLAAGCDAKIGNSPFVVGAFGDYTWGKDTFSASFGGPSFTASLSDHWSLGARLGLQVGSALPYVLVAYEHAKADLGSISSFHGLAWGGGIEIPVAKQISLALEVRDIRYTEETETGSGIKVKPEEVTAMVRLNWSFAAGGKSIFTLEDEPVVRQKGLK